MTDLQVHLISHYNLCHDWDLEVSSVGFAWGLVGNIYAINA